MIRSQSSAYWSWLSKNRTRKTWTRNENFIQAYWEGKKEKRNIVKERRGQLNSTETKGGRNFNNWGELNIMEEGRLKVDQWDVSNTLHYSQVHKCFLSVIRPSALANWHLMEVMLLSSQSNWESGAPASFMMMLQGMVPRSLRTTFLGCDSG